MPHPKEMAAGEALLKVAVLLELEMPHSKEVALDKALLKAAGFL